MNLQKLFLCVLAAGALLVGCKEKEEPVPSAPLLSVTPTELTFAQGGEALVLSLNSNRPWSIETDADWLNFNPASGKAENSAVNVSVTALSNAGHDRQASFKIKTEFDSRTVNVSQKGAKGEDTTDKPSGDGSKENPYNPAGVVAYCRLCLRTRIVPMSFMSPERSAKSKPPMLQAAPTTTPPSTSPRTVQRPLPSSMSFRPTIWEGRNGRAARRM